MASRRSAPLLFATAALLSLGPVPSQETAGQARSEHLRRTDWVSVSSGQDSVQLSNAKELPSGRALLLVKTTTRNPLSELRAQIELSGSGDPEAADLVLDCSAIRLKQLDDRSPTELEGVWRCDGPEGFMEQFLSEPKSKLSLFLASSGSGITDSIVVEPGRIARRVLSTPN